MNKAQKICLQVGAGVVALMLLFPPWVFVERMEGIFQGGGGLEFNRPAGYGFILSPPRPDATFQESLATDLVATDMSISGKRLLIQLIAVAGVVGGLFFVLKSGTKEGGDAG